MPPGSMILAEHIANQSLPDKLRVVESRGRIIALRSHDDRVARRGEASALGVN